MFSDSRKKVRHVCFVEIMSSREARQVYEQYSRNGNDKNASGVRGITHQQSQTDIHKMTRTLSNNTPCIDMTLEFDHQPSAEYRC